MKTSTKILTVLSSGGEVGYAGKVLGYSPAFYWKLDEASGTAVTNYGSVSGADGTHSASDIASGTTFSDGNPAALYNAADLDYTDIYSTALRDNIAPAAITFAWWARYDGSWTDGNSRYMFQVKPNSDNQRWLNTHKLSSNNRVKYSSRVGGTVTEYTYFHSGSAGANWNHYALTINESGDEWKAYYNGSQVGTTLTGLGAWGSPTWNLTTESTIGAANTSPSTTNAWTGAIAHFAIFNSVLSDANVTDLATV